MSEITIEDILEAAKNNGIDITKGGKSGLFIGNQKVEINDLFTDVYEELSVEDKIGLSIKTTVNKEKSHLKFKHITNSFTNEGFGAA